MTAVSLLPPKCDLTLYAGEPNTIVFEFPDTEDYSGETWRAQVRTAPKGTLLATFDISIDANEVSATLSAEDVDDLFSRGSNAYWDLEREGIATVLYGTVNTRGDVTQA